MIVGTLNSNLEMMPLDGAHSPVNKINSKTYEKVKICHQNRSRFKIFFNLAFWVPIMVKGKSLFGNLNKIGLEALALVLG